MSHHGHHGHQSPQSKGSHGHDHPGYEPTDAHAKPLVIFVVILTVSTLACFAIGFVTYRLLEKGQSMIDPGLHPMAVERHLPDGVPRLQVKEAADLKVFREAQDVKVNGYGWISREASVVRVPVDKAMDLLLKNGELKSRADAQQ